MLRYWFSDNRSEKQAVWPRALEENWASNNRYAPGEIYEFIFFSQASERTGILNPRTWLANHALVTGPAFYDMAHGPDFFPAVATTAPKFRSGLKMLPLVTVFHYTDLTAGK